MENVNQFFLFLFSTIAFVFFFYTAPAQSQKELDAHRKKWETPTSAEAMKNPFSNNVAVTDSGRILYQQICSVCHGATGKGDGVAAAGLSVRPANHTSELVQAQTDGTLFYELSNGHAPMPGYKTVLTEKQRWGLINYIRTLKPKPKAVKK
jgi:mono/diheme cytochrome c family protein